MHPVPAGTPILVSHNSNNHCYKVGHVYRVQKVDSDGSFIAVDSHGCTGDWLKWIDCEPVGTGWDWLRGQLDARSLDLLSAFDGVESLQLRTEVESHVIASIPNLADVILNILPSINANAECARESESDDADDESLDLDFTP
jgi:hypothetical protein